MCVQVGSADPIQCKQVKTTCILESVLLETLLLFLEMLISLSHSELWEIIFSLCSL